MSSDPSVPEAVRLQYAEDWGLCGDEFEDTGHMSPQLYIREARRLVGDDVFTQNSAMDKTPRGNLSIGMGCYNFDSHCEERYACDPRSPPCKLYTKPYVAVQCGCHGDSNPGVYQMPVTLLFPKRNEASNLLVPVCASASHVAYATVRMEPQFMILGHAAGVVAALSAKHGTPVQDVDVAEMHALLLADGALLNQTAQPPKKKEMGFRCLASTCFPAEKDKATSRNSSCDGHCPPATTNQWLLLKAHWKVGASAMSAAATAANGTWLKKSELLSRDLPPSEKRAVTHGTVEHFTRPLVPVDGDYWLGDLR